MFHSTRKSGARRAESLIETLTAITVIVIATAAALSVVRTSLQGNTVIGEKVTALNLALEGVEAVRNIRDTNYLRFASDPDTCWDALGATDVSECGSVDRLSDENYTYYVLSRDFEDEYLFEWTLTGTENIDDGNVDQYHMDLDGDDADAELILYAQNGLTDTDDFTIVEQNEGVFNRVITIDEVDGTDSFQVTCTVGWEEKGKSRSVSLTRTLANVN